MTWTIDIVEPADLHSLDAVRALWTEYWNAFGLPSDFQGFDAELRGLPGKYAAPGCLLLATVAGEPAATAAFRPLSAEACEAKRLYVRPAHRRRGLAAAMLHRLAEEARRAGFTTMFGDTLPAMASALDLYRAIGFTKIAAPYSSDPTPGAIYLRLSL